MNIDHLIVSERRKAKKLASTLDLQKGIEQFKKYGFLTIPHEHKDNKPQGGISIVMHGDPLPANFNKPPFFHNHDYYEMVYVYRGTCYNEFRDSKLILHQGDILLMNPHSIHHIYTTRDEDCVFNIMLSRSLFEETMFSLLQNNKLLSNFIINYMYQINTSQDYLYFPTQKNGQADEFITNLIYEFLTHPIEENRSLIYYLLMALLASLARSFADERHIVIPDTSTVFPLPEIINYINTNCTTVTLATLEKEFSYSSAYISRAIKKHCKQNFSQLVQNAKLQRAHDFIQYSTTPLNDISANVGFQDYVYFTKLFKKKFGISPKDYRKLCQEEYENNN